MSLEQYHDRNERSRREQAERDKAIARDAEPYDPSEMREKMPLGCTMLIILGILSIVITLAVVAKEHFWH